MKTAKPIGKWLLLPVAVLTISYVFNVGGYPLMEPDEGRNASVAKTMADDNSYLVPRLNTLPYVDKPVLYFAATAVMMEVLGPSEFAARLSSLLFTGATLLLVGWLGTQWFDRRTGWTAALITGASPLTLAFSRTVIFDAALTFFVVAAIAALYAAAQAEYQSSTRHQAVIGAWAVMALGILTKGPIALGLPLMVVVPYALMHRRGRHLLDTVAILSFIAIIMPWLMVMSTEAAGFLRYALVTETVRRFATDELRRAGPWWYFLPILVAGAAPWTLMVAGGAMERARAFFKSTARDSRAELLLLWIVVPLVFFSLSQSKRVQYVLPLIPALGLAAAWMIQHGKLTRRVRMGTAIVLGIAGVTLLAAPAIVPNQFETSPDIQDALPFVAIMLGSATLIAAAGLLRNWKTHPDILAGLLSLPTLIIPFISVGLMSAIGDTRSSKDLAAAIDNVTTDTAEIVGVHAYPLSLPFYLARPMTLSTEDGHELTSNFIVQFFPDWSGTGTSLQPPDWWLQRLGTCSSPAAFVVRRNDHIRRPVLAAALPLIGENRKYAAYGPCLPVSLATHSR